MEWNLELELAYLATAYQVEYGEETLTIRIGNLNHRIRQICHDYNRTCWAFITPCNPQSKELSAKENQGRLREFEAELQAIGLPYFHGVGVPISAWDEYDAPGDWLPEVSFFILGLEREVATNLARKWEQNAIVWGYATDCAELVWC